MRFTQSIAQRLRELVNVALDRRLLEAIDECEALTETTGNCDWLECRLKDIVREVAIDELRLRREIQLRQDELVE